jgi:hypothetical protein
MCAFINTHPGMNGGEIKRRREHFLKRSYQQLYAELNSNFYKKLLIAINIQVQ